MSYDFIILGADGMQGRIVARDLLENGYSVFAADLYRLQIDPLIKKNKKQAFFTFVDLRDVDMTVNVIQKSGASVIVNCAEGDWNLNVYKAALQTKTHCIDLGSHVEATKEQLKMHPLFKGAQLTAVTGCGSVPGIGNVMLRYAAKKFDTVHTIEAGFAWDSNVRKFVVPFSIQSIIEEFTYPAISIENRKWVSNPPLAINTVRYHKSIGLQKSFLVDHAEPVTFYHYYRNKGARNVRFFAGFPNHSAEKILALIELGFHRTDPVRVERNSVNSLDFLTQLLKNLEFPEGYREKENLWVELTGQKNEKQKKILMECIVPTLKGWEDAGCNIDTGIPASIIARMIKEGTIRRRGSFSPEGIVPEEPFFKELRKRKMGVYEDGTAVN